MSLLQTIKSAQLTARKERNAQASATLTTLIGEAEMVGKTNGNRETTDAEVVATVKKFIKGVDETLGLVKHPDAVAGLQAERALLTQFLPKQMSSEELAVALKTISDELNAHTLREMGKIMKVLKERFDGQYDGAAASTLVKGILQ